MSSLPGPAHIVVGGGSCTAGADAGIVGDPASRVLQFFFVDHDGGSVFASRGFAAGLLTGRGFAQALARNPARQSQDARGRQETKAPHGGMVPMIGPADVKTRRRRV